MAILRHSPQIARSWKKPTVIFNSLYSQFELVIIDSRNATILFKDRMIMDILPQTEIKIYFNSDSKY